MFHFGKNQDNEGTALSRGHGFETTGPIVVVLGGALGLKFLFAWMGFPYDNAAALIVTVLSIIGWFQLRRRRLRKNLKQAHELRKQLHELKQQEFDLKIEEARNSGQLDQWESKS